MKTNSQRYLSYVMMTKFSFITNKFCFGSHNVKNNMLASMATKKKLYLAR